MFSICHNKLARFQMFMVIYKTTMQKANLSIVKMHMPFGQTSVSIWMHMPFGQTSVSIWNSYKQVWINCTVSNTCHMYGSLPWLSALIQSVLWMLDTSDPRHILYKKSKNSFYQLITPSFPVTTIISIGFHFLFLSIIINCHFYHLFYYY